MPNSEEWTQLRHTLQSIETEFDRHHNDFKSISNICEDTLRRADSEHDPRTTRAILEEALKKIRNIVG